MLLGLGGEATMDQGEQRLIEQVVARLADADLTDEVTTHVLSALGAEEAQAQSAVAEPASAYLRSVSVRGFRGIGPATTLELPPGNGLTLVVGRNGSGKSSFSDALEVLLTGTSGRWQGRAKAWQEGWRNLHDGDSGTIEAVFDVEGVTGDTTVLATWGSTDDLAEIVPTVQPHGLPRTDLGAMGWTAAVESLRPFLSYNELGSMLEQGPSKLYDALSSILGLEALTDGAERIRQQRLESERAMKASKAALESLLPEVDELADDEPRAARCAAALRSRTWDLDAVAAVVETADEPGSGDAELSLLRRMATLKVPEPVTLAGHVAALRVAAEALEATAGTDAARADAVARLLKDALALHASHGDSDCPVCGSAQALTPDWRASTESELERLHAEASGVRRARAAVGEAMSAALGEVSAVPGADLETLGTMGVDTATVREAWERWQGCRQIEEPTALADAFETAGPPFIDALTKLTASASSVLEQRQELWRPVARSVLSWLVDARVALAGMGRVPSLKAAEEWVKDTIEDIRTERFRPVAAGAEAIWDRLSEHSNVAISQIVLEGAGTRRRVGIGVAVDDVAGAALGVMSQGELHGLALSLFLPRATLPESPFRFVVIDDPVQAMDPTRVDGLARVLNEVAQSRQVIVFTHDDRLPESVRRLQMQATILEVTRRPGSVVELRKSLDPVAQALDDAWAVARSEGVPDGMKRRVVPAFCRIALEAASTEAVRRRRLGRGDPHDEVEEALQHANRLTHYVALAMFDDADRGGDVLTQLNKIGRWAGDTYQQCNRGVHEGHAGDLERLVNESRSLAERLRILS